MGTKSRLPELVAKYESELLEDWLKEQLTAATLRTDLMPETELRQQSRDFLNAFREALQAGEFADLSAAGWKRVLSGLEGISRARALQGFNPSETATFVLSLKQPLFARIQAEFEQDTKRLTAELWTSTVILDKLGLYTIESYLKGKEEVIRRQQDEMLELSTPVVKLWDQVLALPLIGTLDSARTQVVMENLLQEIVAASASVAIIDITGVPTVDTLVAQHLMKTVAASRLMGAECIISGIRPQIAQTMVHLGVSFADIVTKATLADALRHAFAQAGLRIVRLESHS